MLRRAVTLATFLLAAASCVPAPRQTPAPVAEPTPPPARPALPEPVAAADDWRDWPLTPGTWTYRRDARGSLALFGVPGTTGAAALRCDTARRAIILSVTGAAATAATVRTTSTTRTLALTLAATGDTPTLVAVIQPADPLLDAMAFSRGRFTIERSGTPPLVLPTWAEIDRVIEDCRG